MSDQACDIGEAERDPSKDFITILKSICFVETSDPLVSETRESRVST